MTSPGGVGCRHVLAVLDRDSTIADAAAALARLNGARLSIVQTWSPPLAFWGLDHPSLMPFPISRARALGELAAEADVRLRRVVRELEHPAPLEFRCCRGRASTVALRAARSGAFDAVVVSNCLALRWSRTARELCRSGVLHLLSRAVAGLDSSRALPALRL
jgi:hypothetical protein